MTTPTTVDLSRQPPAVTFRRRWSSSSYSSSSSPSSCRRSPAHLLPRRRYRIDKKEFDASENNSCVGPAISPQRPPVMGRLRCGLSPRTDIELSPPLPRPNSSVSATIITATPSPTAQPLSLSLFPRHITIATTAFANVSTRPPPFSFPDISTTRPSARLKSRRPRSLCASRSSATGSPWRGEAVGCRSIRDRRQVVLGSSAPPPQARRARRLLLPRQATRP